MGKVSLEPKSLWAAVPSVVWQTRGQEFLQNIEVLPRREVNVTTPREHWREVAGRYGVRASVGWCVELLTGAVTMHEPGHPAFNALGSGGYLQRILDGQSPDYWLRVWAARGLLYIWDDSASAAVVAGLSDEHWRVREMCAKVCRHRELGQAGDDLARLVADDVPRVRLAAIMALAGLGEAEHARTIRHAVDDADVKVSLAAEDALNTMSERLDRDLRLGSNDR